MSETLEELKMVCTEFMHAYAIMHVIQIAMRVTDPTPTPILIPIPVPECYRWATLRLDLSQS